MFTSNTMRDTKESGRWSCRLENVSEFEKLENVSLCRVSNIKLLQYILQNLMIFILNSKPKLKLS